MRLLWGLSIILGLTAVARAGDAKLADVKRAAEHADRALGDLRRDVTEPAIAKAEAAGVGCIQAIGAAIDGGATEKTEVEVPWALKDLPGARQDQTPASQGHGAWYAPLGSLRDYCTMVSMS